MPVVTVDCASCGVAAAPAVWIVVLNRRGRAYTLECLHALATVPYANASLVLIDNGCTDFSAEEVAQLIPGAQYLRLLPNRGFTGGVNRGIEHARARGADYALLLNNDATIEPEAVDELLRVAAGDPHIGIVGAKLLQRGPHNRLESAGLHVDLRWGRVYQLGFGEADHGQHDVPRDLMAVSGGAMLLSRAACERTGGFDERYFRYFEDVDICLRARAAGFRVAFAPRARVHHAGKGMGGGRTSPLILYYSVRNHLLLLYEHGIGGRLAALARVPIICLLYVAYVVSGRAGTGWAGFPAIWRGWNDYRRAALGEASVGDS